MAIHMKVNDADFSIHAELLRKEVAEAYLLKTVQWIKEKNITSETRINSTADIFFKKAEEEFKQRLQKDFPHPAYGPNIGLACLGSIGFFDKYRKRTKMSFNNTNLALQV
ncbi:MAG: hypothetical protein JSS10_00290 [Verrucomicrobia bacterium]|nr:hypothetical protein [Verrucomicrobiota bacterium]